jgi:hypothetical protein
MKNFFMFLVDMMVPEGFFIYFFLFFKKNFSEYLVVINFYSKNKKELKK